MTHIEIDGPRFREKSYVIYHIKLQFDQEPIKGPFMCTYIFNMPIPKGISKKKKAQILASEIEHIKRPKCTNMQKFYEHCLKGIVFEDDSQVVVSIARKVYSEHPKTVIQIREVAYDGKRETVRLSSELPFDHGTGIE